MAYRSTDPYQVLSIEVLPVPDFLRDADFDGTGWVAERIPLVLLLADNIAFQCDPRPFVRKR